MWNGEWVKTQIERRGVRDPRVLEVMRRTLRHEFVPPDLQADAYHDGALSIGYGVTISQPYIVALMTELLDTAPDQRVLEIGSGSGYQTAVLSQLVAEVFSVEVIGPLAQAVGPRLYKLGYRNVFLREGDGTYGWSEGAPFDRVIVTAAPASIPPALIDQLRPGGRLVCPVGTADQDLIVLDKGFQGEISSRRTIPVSFVPLVSR